MSEPVTIAEWARNEREMIRVRLDTFNGRDIVDVRSWWRNKAGELRPGRAGITLAVRHLLALADGFAEALALVRERGLIGNAKGGDGRGVA